MISRVMAMAMANTSSESARIQPARLTAESQFQLQFTAVQEGSRGTDQEHWSRLNRSGRPRSQLLMRLDSPPAIQLAASAVAG
jgi:hypothetical protein